MSSATVDGLSISYEVVGEGQPWVITPGGRYSKDSPGVRELATALAGDGNRVLIWDRPNTGASDVRFAGTSESEMQADVLAGLLRAARHGAGGHRRGFWRLPGVAAYRGAHREVAAGLAVWWISGGVYGLMSIGVHYGAGSFLAAWRGGMEAVAALPEWSEPIERNPSNRQRILDQDPAQFIGHDRAVDGRLLPQRHRTCSRPC